MAKKILKLKELRTKYRDKILALAKKRKADKVRIFGSVARGENNTKSDIDFLISLKPGASLIDLSGLKIDLSELLGLDVDVVPENSLHKKIKEHVLQEAVVL